MKTLRRIASLACLLIVLCRADTYGICKSPQYAEIGQQGSVKCEFPAAFSAIIWYDSEDTTNSQVARLERQADGSLRISEDSAEGGTYRITSNGSLIIPFVSTDHDQNFTVIIVDDKSAVSTYVIELITVVYPHQGAPSVNSCEGDPPCLVHSVNETLSCTYRHARPAVILSWYHYKLSEGKLEPLTATQHSFSEDGVTFSSVLTIHIANMTSNVLSVFTCQAVGPALKDQMETNVLVTNALKERCVSCLNEIPKRNVKLGTLLEIPCMDNGIPYAYLWQLEQQNRSKTLVFSVKNKANFPDDVNIAVDVSKDGALIIPKVNFSVIGIYTCFSVSVGISSAYSVEIAVQEGSSTPGPKSAVVMALISAFLLLTIFVGLVAFVYREKIKTFWNLRYYEEMAQTIMSWCIQSDGGSTVFKAEVIGQLREVSEEIEKNRKKKNIGTIAGAAVGIASGGLTILGIALIPFTFGGSVGLSVAGAAVGAAGAGLSIGFSLEKLVKDKKRVDLVKPALQKFLDMQKDLAGAIVFLAIAYEMIRSRQREKYFTNCTLAALRAFNKKIKKSVHTIETFEVKLSNIKKMAKELVNISYLSQCKSEDPSSLQAQWWEEDIQKLTDQPFDYLENALSTIMREHKEVKSVPTFSTFIIHLFVSSNMTEDCQVSQANATQEVKSYAQGGTLAARCAINAVAFGDDAAKVGANVAKIARGVSVAGVVLSAVGMLVDLVFLGHAVCDLLDKEKEKFSQALLDTADVMEQMNKIAFNICVRCGNDQEPNQVGAEIQT